jgi:lysyl-tRNA synthetase class I
MSANRAMRRQLLKEEKHKLLSGMSQTIQTAKAQATKEAAESTLAMAKNIASRTITDVVIPAIQETLKNSFNFDESQINKFMTAFTEEADKIMENSENKEEKTNEA